MRCARRRFKQENVAIINPHVLSLIAKQFLTLMDGQTKSTFGNHERSRLFCIFDVKAFELNATLLSVRGRRSARNIEPRNSSKSGRLPCARSRRSVCLTFRLPSRLCSENAGRHYLHGGFQSGPGRHANLQFAAASAPFIPKRASRAAPHRQGSPGRGRSLRRFTDL